jgi:hypothetical protein
MDANSPPPTAKIYPFPRKPAASPGGPGQQILSATDRRRALPSVEFGSGWYHEAAIQADWPRKP